MLYSLNWYIHLLDYALTLQNIDTALLVFTPYVYVGGVTIILTGDKNYNYDL